MSKKSSSRLHKTNYRNPSKHKDKISITQKEQSIVREDNSLFSKSNLFFALIVTLLGAIIYWPSFHAPFVFDDIRNIVNNYPLHLDSLAPLALIRLRYGISGNRPLAMLSFAINYYIGGLNPFGYHLFNLIIHILSTLILYRLTYTTLNLPKIKDKYHQLAHPIAVTSSILFLVHPVNTQAVTYIVQRMTSLACMFFLLTLLTYIRGRQSSGKQRCIWWFVAAVSALCSFVSKENSATLPFFVILYELYFFKSTPLKRRLVWLLLLLPLTLTYSYTRFDLSPVLTKAANQRHITYTQHVFTQLRVIVLYINLMIFPHPSRLNLDYNFAYSLGLFQPFSTFLSLLVLLSSIVLSLKSFRKRPFVSLGITWFIGNLAIESGLVLADPVFEHRLYLPGIGILWLIGMGLVVFWEKYLSLKGQGYKAWGISLFVFCVILSIWTFQRNLVWADMVSLWQDTVNKSPAKARPRNNLANALGSRGEYEKALNECKKALELDPDYAQTYHNLGMIYTRLGDDKQAIKYYREAVKHDNNLIQSHNNLANAYMRQGEYKKAISVFKLLLRKDPFFATFDAPETAGKTTRVFKDCGEFLAAAYNNLGTAYQKLGQFDEASKHFRRALQINPSFGEAQLNLGVTLAQQGSYKEALSKYETALKLLPNSPELRYNLGHVYYLLGNKTQARNFYKQALDFKPDLSQAYFGLAKIASEGGNYQEAIKNYQEGILLQPDLAQMYNELGNAYYMANRYTEAIDVYKQALSLNSNLVEIHNNLGLVYAALGQYQEAIEQHQLAITKNPSSPNGYNHLGYIYLYYLKQPQKALSYLQKSLSIAPGQRDFNQLKATIQKLKTNTH